MMDIPETHHEAVKRLDQQIERDRKLSNRFYITLMGTVFLILALAFYLLHLQIQQSHIA